MNCIVPQVDAGDVVQGRVRYDRKEDAAIQAGSRCVVSGEGVNPTELSRIAIHAVVDYQLWPLGYPTSR